MERWRDGGLLISSCAGVLSGEKNLSGFSWGGGGKVSEEKKKVKRTIGASRSTQKNSASIVRNVDRRFQTFASIVPAQIVPAPIAPAQKIPHPPRAQPRRGSPSKLLEPPRSSRTIAPAAARQIASHHFLHQCLGPAYVAAATRGQINLLRQPAPLSPAVGRACGRAVVCLRGGRQQVR